MCILINKQYSSNCAHYIYYAECQLEGNVCEPEI